MTPALMDSNHLQTSFVFVGNAYAPAVWAYPVTDFYGNYGRLDPMHFILTDRIMTTHRETKSGSAGMSHYEACVCILPLLKEIKIDVNGKS
jgi:hypothetical protein